MGPTDTIEMKQQHKMYLALFPLNFAVARFVSLCCQAPEVWFEILFDAVNRQKLANFPSVKTKPLTYKCEHRTEKLIFSLLRNILSFSNVNFFFFFFFFVVVLFPSSSLPLKNIRTQGIEMNHKKGERSN